MSSPVFHLFGANGHLLGLGFSLGGDAMLLMLASTCLATSFSSSCLVKGHLPLDVGQMDLDHP